MSGECQSISHIKFGPRQTKIGEKPKNKPRRAGTIPSSSFIAKAEPSGPPSKPMLVKVSEALVGLTPLGGGTGCNPGANGKGLDASVPKDSKLDGVIPQDKGQDADGLIVDKRVADLPDYQLAEAGKDFGPKEGGTDISKDITPPKDKGPDQPPLDKGPDKFIPKPDKGPDWFVQPDKFVPKPDKGPVCNTPGTPIKHTKFNGTKTSVESWSIPGYLIPERNWTYCWQATSGKLPGSPFKLKDTSGKGGNPTIVTDTTGEKAMKMDSLTKNLNGLYQYEWYKPSGLGTTWSFQARLRLGKTETTPSKGESSIGGYDKQYAMFLVFSSNQIDEYFSKKTKALATNTDSITFRGEINNGNFIIYSNESSQLLTGAIPLKTAGSDSQFIIGDATGPNDAITYINSFCFEPKTSIPGTTSPPKYEASITLPKLGTKAKIKMVGTNSNVTLKAQTSVDGKTWSSLQTTKMVSGKYEVVSNQSVYKHVKVVAELSSTKPSRLGTFSLEWTQCN